MLTIQYKPVDWCFQNIYEENKRLHDIGKLVQSIQTHGFRNPPLWDDTLNRVVAGNGRIETLYKMWQLWQNEGGDVPTGIEAEGDMWLVPIVFGAAAESIEAAIAFLLDDNNLTLMGGDFTAVDTLRMWDDGYIDLLRQASDHLVSVDKTDINLMAQLADLGEPLELNGVAEEPTQFENDPTFFVRIVFEDEEKRDAVREMIHDNAAAGGVSPGEYLFQLLDQQ